MNDTTTYKLKPLGYILKHFPAKQAFVHDSDDDTDLLRQARIRSGDYLMTLSTELDKIAQSLTNVNAPEAAELERIVAELIYIEKNYSLAPNSK